ncbi:MAG: response regulator, partial [Deltaproteobacteria bacterium]|nr:response regulator [Deltaproteobacteria bacterium]
MTDNEPGRDKHTILFVDDEEFTITFFKKRFEKEYNIITATNADEGWKVIKKTHARLALVISDQRMEGTQGAEFLGQVRDAYPGIVRILTTAYADLGAAIDAVNQGAIYQYVKKPWDIGELTGILKRATDLYVLQRERDLLQKGKLNVMQRMMITNRVHSLAMVAAGLGSHINHPLSALAAFMAHVPESIQEDWAHSEPAKRQERWHDLGALAGNESKIMGEMGK